MYRAGIEEEIEEEIIEKENRWDGIRAIKEEKRGVRYVEGTEEGNMGAEFERNRDGQKRERQILC